MIFSQVQAKSPACAQLGCRTEPYTNSHTEDPASASLGGMAE